MVENSSYSESFSQKEYYRISVVMCTYNGARFLAEQLDSIVKQTYPIFELIVQDDGSTDNTQQVVEDYASRYPYIHFYHHEGEPGVNRNFYSAMARATGDLIAICDQDDVWELKKLEWQVEALGENWLVGGISRPFSTDGTLVSFDSRIPNIHLLRMLFVGMMPGHTQLFRRELLQYIPEPHSFMYDLEIQAMAASAGKVAYVKRVVVNQRRHLTAATYAEPTNRTHSLSNIYHSARECLRIYRAVRPTIRERFTLWLKFFANVPWDTPALEAARKMSELQRSRSFWGWCRLTWFCIQQRRFLFHAPEKNAVLAVFRAAFFPISCATYYRYVLTDTKKLN